MSLSTARLDKAALVCAVLSCAALLPCAHAADAPGEASFVVSEEHTTTPVTEAPRAGWIERRDTLRFGGFGLSVVQRINPQTGLPAQEGTRWGDAFVGVIGHKPETYMASNWSPWDFLNVHVRLQGDAADLPQPTRLGLLVHAHITQPTADRAVAEACWRDAAGGLTRARFSGRRGTPGFALSLRYFPPEGRRTESLRYELVCQPYDYSDRGHWQRRRWLSTPARDLHLASGQEVPLTLDTEWLSVYHNRCAQTDAGTWLAIDEGNVTGASVRAEGNTVRISLTPAALDADVHCALGDWVDRNFTLTRSDVFASAPSLQEMLAEAAATRSPDPALPDEAEEADIVAILTDHPTLHERFSQQVNETRRAITAAFTELEATGPDESLNRYAALRSVTEARGAREALHRAIRAAWVETKGWGR